MPAFKVPPVAIRSSTYDRQGESKQRIQAQGWRALQAERHVLLSTPSNAMPRSPAAPSALR
jgi:hypothetical protein